MSRLVLRNLLHYWRTNLAVVAGVAISVAVLSGALLLGRSVRESLRDLVFQRLGATDFVVSSDRFFREDLAGALAKAGQTSGVTRCPMIHLQGVLARERTRQRARPVHVYGVDARFWRFHGAGARSGPDGRSAFVGSSLAESLGIQPGDTLLLRLETPGSIPRESLFGRHDSVGRTIRLEHGATLSPEQLGEFSLQPSQGSVASVFVPLARLQKDLAQPSLVNTVLVSSRASPSDLERLRAELGQQVTLQDLGVRLRPLPRSRGVAVESARILLDERLARAARDAAADGGLPVSGVLSYLANAIRAHGREIPYSVITAADLGQGALTAIERVGGVPPAPASLTPDESIWLNEWAWRELGISPGDPVEVDYYRWQDDGRLSADTARFRLAGVVSIGGDVDASLAPDIPGVSEARSVRAWDPPFPLDLRRIRPRDEEYWHRHRATPKAFVTLARGQQLWHTRFGQLSSVRIAMPGPSTPGGSLREVTEASSLLAARLRSRLDPEVAGLAITAVRARGLDASAGSTDFGEYFVYFSFFLIVAALLLAALFFRLGVEQRVREIGTLQALGFPATTIRRIFVLEAAILSGAGSLLGVLGAIGYGGILVLGLRTWWVGAVGTQRLFLHLSAGDLAVGATVGVVASLGAIAWTLRGLRHASARAMLAGILESGVARRRRARFRGLVSLAAFLTGAAVLAAAATGAIPDVAGFFGAGVLLLVSLLGVASAYLRRTSPHSITHGGRLALLRLGARSVTHRPGRSLLCVALIAIATFVIVSVEAFRKDSEGAAQDRSSGTGGFALVMRSTLPIVYDPNSLAGREALGIDASERPELAHVRFVPFRERPGDDASCLNLYAPHEPRILGAPSAFLAEGRFSFQDSVAATPEQRRNPWTLLETTPADGAIPAIGDANTIQYILHRAVGQDVVVRGDDGAPVRLRLVAALRDSILQGELLIAETHFLRAFPEREGYRFFLLDVPSPGAGPVARGLEEGLADWGVDIESTSARLAAYHRVENTYLSTFQSLGALGLILGTFGLAAVLLRNVFERRQELALLRAVGYNRNALTLVIVAENALLTIGGLMCGSACALVAILPALLARGGSFPCAAVILMLLAVLVGGLLSSTVAVRAAWRTPLLEALRSE